MIRKIITSTFVLSPILLLAQASPPAQPKTPSPPAEMSSLVQPTNSAASSNNETSACSCFQRNCRSQINSLRKYSMVRRLRTGRQNRRCSFHSRPHRQTGRCLHRELKQPHVESQCITRRQAISLPARHPRQFALLRTDEPSDRFAQPQRLIPQSSGMPIFF
jgi:hypothetical protein